VLTDAANAPSREVVSAGDHKREDKGFFSEEKNQTTFLALSRPSQAAQTPEIAKVFPAYQPGDTQG
jgi:hypothetical protein